MLVAWLLLAQSYVGGANLRRPSLVSLRSSEAHQGLAEFFLRYPCRGGSTARNADKSGYYALLGVPKNACVDGEVLLL